MIFRGTTRYAIIIGALVQLREIISPDISYVAELLIFRRYLLVLNEASKPGGGTRGASDSEELTSPGEKDRFTRDTFFGWGDTANPGSSEMFRKGVPILPGKSEKVMFFSF
ncbi:MAG: hypothetical protein ABFC24_01845 [Methanoregulaceae archaeon]